MSTTYNFFFDKKKEIFNSKQLLYIINRCLECEIETLSPVDTNKSFLFGTMPKFNAQNKFRCHNRDKSNYFSLTFNLESFSGHHLPMAYLQLNTESKRDNFYVLTFVADLH